MVRWICALMLAIGVVAGDIGSVSAQTAVDSARVRANQGTVSIISGGVNGTYIRIASDLAAVLDKGDQLRVLPILGKGSLQNISDLLYLRGIDVAIVQSDVLSFIRRQNIHPNIEQRIRYVTKLYNEEVHVLARREIARIEDLNGKKVNVDVAGSGTSMTAATLFGTLGIPFEPTNYDQALALENLKAGEISAMVYVAGKPTDLFRKIEAESGLHFLAVPLTRELLETYLPSSLSNAEYPTLVDSGQTVETVAVGAVMAVYNWDRNNERYKRVAVFVETFFEAFPSFLKAPRHPKWQEVNLAATLPGWRRFQPAEDWLNRLPTLAAGGPDQALKASFDEFMRFMAASGASVGGPVDARTREEMFARFMEWRGRQPADQTTPVRP